MNLSLSFFIFFFPHLFLAIHFMPTLTATLTSNTTNTTIPTIKSRKRKLVTSYVYHYLSLVYEFVYTFFIVKPKQHLISKRRTPVLTSANTTTGSRQRHSKGTLQYYKGKTLVLDLDETLVHSVRLGSQEANYPVSPSIKRKQIEVQSEKQSLLYQVYKRPHVDFFLKTASITMDLPFFLFIWPDSLLLFCTDRYTNDSSLIDKPMVQSRHLYCVNVRIR